MVEDKIEIKLGGVDAESETTQVSSTGGSAKKDKIEKKVTVNFKIDGSKPTYATTDNSASSPPKAGLKFGGESAAAPAPAPKPHSILKQASSGKLGKISLGFDSLNTDFSLPKDFTLIKKLGKGAYGKVMQIMHQPSQREYACKRFEYVFSDK